MWTRAGEGAEVSKDLTQGREKVSVPQGEGSARARAWIKRAGHRPAAQEGGRQDREPFVPTSQGAGGVAGSPTRMGGGDAGPRPRVQTQCAQQDSRPAVDGPRGRHRQDGRAGSGDSRLACRIRTSGPSSGGSPGASGVPWAFPGIAETRTPPGLLNAGDFSAALAPCPAWQWEVGGAGSIAPPPRCSPVPFIMALGDRHTQDGRSQHHVVADVRGDEDVAQVLSGQQRHRAPVGTGTGPRLAPAPETQPSLQPRRRPAGRTSRTCPGTAVA